MHVDEAVDEVDFLSLEFGRESAPAPAQGDRRLKLMGATPGEGGVPLLKFRQQFAEFGFAVQQFRHDVDCDGFILVVEQRDQTFKAGLAVHSERFS